jgi:hypothetical protein
VSVQKSCTHNTYKLRAFQNRVLRRIFRLEEQEATIQNLIQEEIKRRLNLGNVCYHSVQNLLSSRLLSKNIRIRIYKTIIFAVIVHWCRTRSLTLREEHRLWVFENRVLKRIFGSNRDKVTGG